MKIAMVNQPWSTSPPSTSADSIAILAYEMSCRLGCSHDVVSYAPRFSEQAASERCEGILYRRLRRWPDRALKPLRALDSLNLLALRKPHVSSVFYFPGYILQVARDLARRQFDIIHLHNFSQFVPIVRALNPSARIVLHMHCDWLTMLDRKMIRGRLQKADVILGVSDFVTARIQRQFPEFASRCRTLYNGVDTDYFCPDDEARAQSDGERILYVGRVSPEKGIHVLLEAFERVLEKFPRATLDIVGPAGRPCREFLDPGHDEPLLEPLERFFRDRNSYLPELQRRLSTRAAGAVNFVGLVPHHCLRTYYQRADLAVIPSVINEPFGIPLAEAMASGLPAIATRGGGFPEIIEHETSGLLVPRADAAALADSMIRLLADRELRRVLGAAARKRVIERFRWEVIMPQLDNAYRINADRNNPVRPEHAADWRITSPNGQDRAVNGWLENPAAQEGADVVA